MNPKAGRYGLIAIAGHKRAGKDTCAQILKEALGFVPIAFAEPLKSEIVDAFGVDPSLFYGDHTKERPTVELAIGRCNDARFIRTMERAGHGVAIPRSPRQIMQWWGTEFRRGLDGLDYWLNLLQDVIDTHRKNGVRRLVITDVRFPNEAEFARDNGATVWQIRRAGLHQMDHHESEVLQASLVPDRTITNDGSLQDLARQVLLAAAQDV